MALRWHVLQLEALQVLVVAYLEGGRAISRQKRANEKGRDIIQSFFVFKQSFNRPIEQSIDHLFINQLKEKST